MREYTLLSTKLSWTFAFWRGYILKDILSWHFATYHCSCSTVRYGQLCLSGILIPGCFKSDVIPELLPLLRNSWNDSCRQSTIFRREIGSWVVLKCAKPLYSIACRHFNYRTWLSVPIGILRNHLLYTKMQYH